jgi:type IV secretory pathway TraG/TraD family ATPase VirD4
MIEPTSKEKEFSSSLTYAFLVPMLFLFVTSLIFQFNDTIIGILDKRIIVVYNSGVKLLLKIQINQILSVKNLILSLHLVLMMLLVIISKSKINPKSTKNKALKNTVIGVCFGLIISVVTLPDYGLFGMVSYTILYAFFSLFTYKGLMMYHSIAFVPPKDIFNEYNEQFPQNEKDIDSEVAVRFRTQYQYKNKWREGTIPVVNPMRAVLVVGSQGSGKTFTILVPAIRQSINKGYCGVIYDYKFPDLSKQAYNALLHTATHNPGVWRIDSVTKKRAIPKFSVIDFENLKYSNRSNPFNRDNMQSIDDCNQMAKTLMLNLNKSWIKKEGDFWALSAINLLTCILWWLRLLENEHQDDRLFDNICNLPFAIEFLNKEPKALFAAITKYRELDSYSSMFALALANQAGSQIAGQIASTQAALAQISSPNIYWVMSADDLDLQVNNPEKPQIICLGNSPVKSGPYGAALSVYTSTIMKKVYSHKEIPCGMFLDELPSMYLMGLDEFIAQVRSYKVATWLGVQDFEQLTKSYGKEPADVVINTCGTVFAGQVGGSSAERLSKMFGDSMQGNVDTSVNKGDQSVSYKTSAQRLLPPSKIATLSQGSFAGKVADNFDQPIDLKLFNAYVNVEKKHSETPHEIPLRYDVTDEKMATAVITNYNSIKDRAAKIMQALS